MPSGGPSRPRPAGYRHGAAMPGSGKRSGDSGGAPRPRLRKVRSCSRAPHAPCPPARCRAGAGRGRGARFVARPARLRRRRGAAAGGGEQCRRGAWRHAVVHRLLGGSRGGRPRRRGTDPRTQRAPQCRPDARPGPAAPVSGRARGGLPVGDDRGLGRPGTAPIRPGALSVAATARDPQPGRPTSSTLSAGVFTIRAGFAAYGRRVSGVMENRAADFASEPQAVEVFQAGTWWSGELLGWRHDSHGTCQVWVRVEVAGVEETAWTELSALRLPERRLTVASEFAAAPSPRRAARVVESARRHAHPDDLASTAGLPMVRDVAAVAPRARRRAPEEADVQVASAPSVSVSAGRHRAPATGAIPVVTETGRHRAADTGLFPAASGAVASAERSSGPPTVASRPISRARAVRTEEPVRRPRDSWTAPSDQESDLLTRPLRLSDHITHARRPRLDGSLSSV